MYLPGKLKLHKGSVTGRKINITLSGEAHGWSQVDVPMSVHNVNCIFCMGDDYKGQTSMVNREEDRCLTVWTTLSEESMSVSCLDSESRSRLTLLSH